MRMIASAGALLLGLLAAGCNGELVGGGHRPAQLLVVSGDLQTGTVGQELAQPLVVKVVDDAGKPVRDQLVNFRVTRGGGSVFAGSAITNRDGIAQERWTLGTVADTQQVEARAVDSETGAAIVFATFRAVARAGTPSTIAAVGSAQVTGLAGMPLADSVAVLVRDAYGNPVPGVQVAWSVGGGGGSVSPPTSTTSAQGIARAQWTLGGSLSGAQTLQAAAGVSLTTTFTANAGVGASATVTVVSGGGQTGPVAAELAQPLVVEVRQNGQPLAGAQVVWAPAPGMGTATPATSLTDAQGRASTRWALGNTVGTQTMAVQVPGASAVVFFTAQATPGAAATLEMVVPPADANPGYGGRDTLYARVRDAQGNAVPGAAVSWTVLNGGGAVTAQSTTGPDGVAWAIWQLGTDDTEQAVAASAAGVDPLVYDWSLLNSLPPASFAKVAGDGQAPAMGATVDHRMAVRLTDAQGNGIYDAAVQWINPAGDVVQADSTNLEGYSFFWATADSTAAPQTFTARTAGMADVTFTVTPVAGPANGIRVGRDTVVVYGTGQTRGIPFTLYDGAGMPVDLGLSERYNGVAVTLLDNTGVIERVTLGMNIRSHGYRTLAMGTERIQVRRTNGTADTVTIHVREPDIEPGMLIGMRAAMPHEMEVGQTTRAAVFVVIDATTMQGAQQVTWSSSSTSVATIDAAGNITAVGPGVAVITAHGAWGGTVHGYVLVRRP